MHVVDGIFSSVLSALDGQQAADVLHAENLAETRRNSHVNYLVASCGQDFPLFG